VAFRFNSATSFHLRFNCLIRPYIRPSVRFAGWRCFHLQGSLPPQRHKKNDGTATQKTSNCFDFILWLRFAVRLGIVAETTITAMRRYCQQPLCIQFYWFLQSRILSRFYFHRDPTVKIYIFTIQMTTKVKPRTQPDFNCLRNSLTLFTITNKTVVVVNTCLKSRRATSNLIGKPKSEAMFFHTSEILVFNCYQLFMICKIII